MGLVEPSGVPPCITVEVVWSPAARQIQQCTLSMAASATVHDALLASGLADPHQDGLAVGIWGRRASLGTRLRDQDRLEIYRPLTVDPKEARRVRYRAHTKQMPKGRFKPKVPPASQP